MNAENEFTAASALVLLVTSALLISGYAWTTTAPISTPPRVAPPSSVDAQPAPMPLFPAQPTP